MPSTTATIFLDKTTWRLCVGDDSQESVADGRWSPKEVAGVAEKVAEVLENMPRRVQRSVALLLGSDLCLTAHFDIDSPRQLRKRDAMLYQLEEWLPCAAEDLVADYYLHRLQVLAVAAEKRPIELLIAGLRQRGIAIDFVAPVAMLAAQCHLARPDSAQDVAALWVSSRGCGELVLFDQGHPVHWESISDTVRDLRQLLNFQALQHAELAKVTVYVEEGAYRGEQERLLRDNAQLAVHSDAASLEHMAIDSLAKIRSGAAEPLLQLTAGWQCNSTLARPLHFEWVSLQVAVLLLLAAIVTTNVRKASSYSVATSQLQVAEEDVFREVFPDARLPRGIRTRLESELTKLAGARGDAKEVTSGQSALTILQRFLASLPSKMRYRFLEVRVEAERLDLMGEVRSFSDADQIAASLRNQELTVKAPTTQRLPEQGVSFRLSAAAQSIEGSPNVSMQGLSNAK